MLIKPIKIFNKTLAVPGDKSITHRAIMLNGIARGSARIRGALLGEDCLSTAACMRALGAKVDIGVDGTVSVTGTQSFANGQALDVGNSGTTIRLLSGLISGLGISASLSGDDSIRRRPMQRVATPLGLMGANIATNKGFAPLSIKPAALTGIEYDMPVMSAQVKSAILLAGLNASGATIVHERGKTRDHTELMLKAMGADIRTSCGTVEVRPSELRSADVDIPADISGAAYFIALATVLPSAEVFLPNIGVNPTRTGILDVLMEAGANIKLTNPRTVCGEPVADITVKSAKLRPFSAGGELIPRLIDEIPLLAVIACFIEGKSTILDARELRIKESDRIATTAEALTALGADIEPAPDGFVIRGSGGLMGGGVVNPYGDHRIAMSMAIAGAASQNGARIDGEECVNISFPGFWENFGA